MFLRVREQPQISNQTRFGVAYQRAPGNGCSSRAFLQFTGVDPADPDPNNPTMPLKNAIVCFDSDPDIDWANTTQRYAVTFEEWLQQEGFGFRLHWFGSVYSVNTSTQPWTYTCLGSKEWQSHIYDWVQSGDVTVRVPALDDSKIMAGAVFFAIGVDLAQFYVAKWVY